MIEYHDGNMFGCLTTNMMSIMFPSWWDMLIMFPPFELKHEDISKEGMTFILNYPDYIYVSSKIEFKAYVI